MSNGHQHDRQLLEEAFVAGWQAALAVRITNPRVLAVVDSCFELWLEEAADEAEVLGLPFRRREDLPLVRREEPVATPAPTVPHRPVRRRKASVQTAT